MKSKLVYLTVLVALALFSRSALAQPVAAPRTDMHQGGFTNASLQGSYAATGIVGTNEVAFVGVCHLDGTGAFDCAFNANVPGEEEGARSVFPATSEGEYTVNPDGTGTLHEVETLPDGSTAEYDHDFVITHADAIGPYVVATEIRSLVRQGFGPAGSLGMAQLTRLPDAAMAPVMAGAEQRIFRVVAVSDAGVDANGVHHRIALSGDGTFTANHVNASGTFVHFDQAPEGTPKPILAAGNWQARKVLSYSGSLGAAGGIDAGILEMEVELFPEGGPAITGVLRIVCNIGFAGIMTGEPEGYQLTVPGPEGSPELTFVPLDPVLGLTHIGAPGAR